MKISPAQAVIAAATVAVALLIGAAVLIGWHNAQLPAAAATPGRAPSPTLPDWRTEHFRNISFHVPASWTTPRQAGGPGGDSVEIDPPNPERLLTEHVSVHDVTHSGPPTTQESNGAWILTRTVDHVRIKAVSPDRHLAEQIVASANVSEDELLCGCPQYSSRTEYDTRLGRFTALNVRINRHLHRKTSRTGVEQIVAFARSQASPRSR